ncbi:MAG: type II/IV secretion system ATPase subunit [Candidatus Aenigmarchaeota archaeon]|nr:type II/IV secretion system ATPase subunit [Candidatus Aenigmarchaeota archaeon]
MTVSANKVFNEAVKALKKKKEAEEKEKAPQYPMMPYPYPVKFEAPKEERKPAEGISLVEVSQKYVLPKKDEEDARSINLSYALIPRGSAKPFAAANIRWVSAESALVYFVIEPKLTPDEQDILNRIKASLIEKLDIDFTTLRKGEAKTYLLDKFKEMLSLLAKDMPKEKQDQLLYYIERDFIGLEKIEPLIQDEDIEDISCDGVGIPMYIYHRNPKIGSIRTNVMFNSAEELDKFVNKLSQRCGKTVSVASPLIGGSLPDGSRVQATLGTDIARRGSNFTIRKFTEEPLTPIHLMKFKTVDAKVLSYLWLLIEHGRSMLVSGGTASGKTSLLNALSLFIKTDLKIVSIEDTPELRLPHPHWIPQVARQPIADIGGRSIGEVDLFDLLRESLRQRPDFLIVGEVRGKEAFVLFQQIATGHPSLATIHADTVERLIDRITTPPISLPPNLIEALDVIVFITKIRYENSYLRKITNVFEVTGFDRERNMPILNEVFRWNPKTDKFDPVNPSVVLKRISDQYGISPNFLQGEIEQRSKILNWMYEKELYNFKDVTKVIKLYYTRPEELLDLI